MRFLWKPDTKPSVKFIELTCLYLVIGFLLTLIIVARIDSTIVMGKPAKSMETSMSSVAEAPEVTASRASSSTAAGSSTPISTESTSVPGISLTTVPFSASDVSFSSDDQFCTYISNGKLFVIDIAKDEIIHTIEEKAEITSAVLMRNQNIVIYCTTYQSSGSSSGTLTLKTYNLETGYTAEQKVFDIPNGAVVRKMDYSTVTSYLTMDIRSGSGDVKNDSLYYLTIMKKLRTNSLGAPIGQMVVLNNAAYIYYDINGKLHSIEQHVAEFRNAQVVPACKDKEVQLLGCDGNDNIYLQSLTDKNTIFVLDTQNSIKSINLQDSGYSRIYSDKISLYVIYKDHIINLSSVDNAGLSFLPNMDFIGMGGSYVYFYNEYGEIIALPKTV